jgi:MFS family permease
MGRLLGLAMFLLAGALIAFPLVRTLPQVYLYAAALGVAGGVVTVVFFGVWGQTFGPAHLGKIQGAAQMLTALASAAGPLLLAVCQRWTGSYTPRFQGAAAVAAVLALCAWCVPLPAPPLKSHEV